VLAVVLWLTGIYLRPDYWWNLQNSFALLLNYTELALLSIGLTAPHSADHVPGVGPGGFVASACLVACALAAVQHGRLGGAALGALGGALYGAGDLATKALVSSGSLVATWAFVVAIATLGAFFCFQRGLQLGPPLAVIALMTAATNLVSIAGAVVVLGEPVGSTPALETLHGLALVLVAGAAWMLAPVQAALVGVPIHRRRTAPRRGRRVPLPVRGPSG
jgi:ribose transport system permease protein